MPVKPIHCLSCRMIDLPRASDQVGSDTDSEFELSDVNFVSV